MANSYLSSSELLPSEASATDGIRAWAEMEDTCEAFVRAGLRQEIGPRGDLDAAYRKWYDRYAEEKSKAFVRMCEKFSHRR